MEDLNRAQGPGRRIEAITIACESFDHVDEAKHNIELYHGAVQALARVLGLASNDDESRMICAALEMVFRGSPKSVKAAYDRVGPAIVSHMVRLLDRSSSGNMKHPEITILNIARTLCSLSRCSELKPGLCRHTGLLKSLVQVFTGGGNSDCRCSIARFLASLASHEDNKVVMYEQDGLVDAILRSAYFETTDLIRQYAASVLMSLASATPNQVTMAKNDKVLGIFVKMALSEKNERTRESVVTGIQNLAFSKENRRVLVSFRDGIVLEALKKSLLTDPDPKTRRRAAGALTNLSCNETGAAMGNHRGLLEALAIAATKDGSADVQGRASIALTKVANSITVKMECFSALLNALVVASLSKVENSISAVLRVKARDPMNRRALAQHTGVLDTLSDICLSDTAVANERDNAVRAIMHLVNEPKNQRIMCSQTILNALVKAANYKDPDLDEARDSAVRAMERLGTEPANRPMMAKHDGLLTVVAKAVEREATWEDAGKDSESGFFAKPLLMSLLLAM